MSNTGLIRACSSQSSRRRLFDKVDELLDAVGQPRSLKDAGVLEDEFEQALPDLARMAFAEPSLRTNPRMPLMAEIVQLLQLAYDGGA